MQIKTYADALKAAMEMQSLHLVLNSEVMLPEKAGGKYYENNNGNVPRKSCRGSCQRSSEELRNLFLPMQESFMQVK